MKPWKYCRLFGEMYTCDARMGHEACLKLLRAMHEHEEEYGRLPQQEYVYELEAAIKRNLVFCAPLPATHEAHDCLANELVYEWNLLHDNARTGYDRMTYIVPDDGESEEPEEDDAWRREIAHQAGMMGGMQAYNDHMGVGTYEADCTSCGGRGCPRCYDEEDSE